tara:strand:+ start:155 stop:388 length:234 start_codon:yes stop_codon:yes gene_type:complete
MKNPVFFANNKEQVIFIYHIYDKSLLQIAKIEGSGTTILNIPPNSHIAVKKGTLIGEFMVPIETIFETRLLKNHYQL